MWLVLFLATKNPCVAAQRAIANMDHSCVIGTREKSVVMAACVDIDAMPMENLQQRRIIDDFYPAGGTVIRAMAAKLKAGGIISPHRDSHPSFRNAHRIHIPITTNTGVRFMINGRPHRFEVGKAYEINNQMNHSVINAGKQDRITFIFDYLPPKES